MSKSTLSKILGWSSAFLLYAQGAIATQSVLPHNFSGWAHLLAAIAVGFAVHTAASTDGEK